MQRHRASKGEAALPVGTSSSAPEPPQGQPGVGMAAKWKLELPVGLERSGQSPVVTEAPTLSGPQALLKFKPGRRSFGQFNSKLERRLADIGEKKREAAAEIARVRAAEELRARQLAEFEELKARADASEEVEKRTGVSEEEMAQRFARFVPNASKKDAEAAFLASTSNGLDVPPEVVRPIRVSDAPIGAASAGAKRKGGGSVSSGGAARSMSARGGGGKKSRQR
eukprot:scaffold10117_cov111-Isochrysis_galbana.AAC.8